MTHQAPFQIRFHLAGPALDQVIRWQRETDLRVIRYQIETRGGAVAVMYEGKLQLHSVKQVPPPGQSIPWYGDDGSSYQFTFRPTDEGYRLRVEMTLAGREFFFADAIAPLELTVPELIRIEPATDDQLWWGMDWGWWCGPARESSVEALTFILNSQMYSELEVWGWDRGRWQTYEYGFLPSSVGCEMYVRDTLTGAEECLTKDACW